MQGTKPSAIGEEARPWRMTHKKVHYAVDN
jgi:hypothetical protein